MDIYLALAHCLVLNRVGPVRAAIGIILDRLAGAV